MIQGIDIDQVKDFATQIFEELVRAHEKGQVRTWDDLTRISYRDGRNYVRDQKRAEKRIRDSGIEIIPANQLTGQEVFTRDRVMYGNGYKEA